MMVFAALLRSSSKNAVQGESALAALKQCVTRGVYAGGDMEGRERAPIAAADFLGKVFAAIR